MVADKTTEPDEPELADSESDCGEKLEDSDQRRTIKVKPFGGPLLAQV